VIASGTGTALYVYGVVPADADVSADLVRSGDVAAMVRRVDLAEFGEEPLRRNLEDRDWLEAAVRAHDDVLAQAVGRVPLVPLRFGTVYTSGDGVREMLDERRVELNDALARLSGCVELGVKVFLRDAGQRDDAEPASGREYLLRKQRARDTAESARGAALDSVRALHDRLLDLADDARVNRPQPSELSGRSEAMLLNAAYLVRTEQQPEFTAAAEDGADAGLEIVVTGPWPAYNFVEPGDAE
jgi:hypothetical protein